MNTETHLRMVGAGIGLVGGSKLVGQKSFLANVLGVVAAGYGTFELIEIYNDWHAGFEAAKHIGPWYAERMKSRRLFIGNSRPNRRINIVSNRPHLLANRQF